MSTSKKILICLAIFTLPAIGPLFVPGYFGASDDLHIAWLQQLTQSLQSGQFPVRYVPDLSYGFGYPLFNFVFPLPFYFAVIPYLLGLSLVASIKMILALSLILSAYAFYWAVKPVASRQSALIASLIYLYTPYRSTDIYVRGALGEAVAFIFFPLVLGGILRIYSTSVSKKNISVTALGISGLILSHNISAYMFAPAIAILVLFLSIKNSSGFVKSFIAGLLGLMTSSFFWLPALKDSQLVTYSTVFNFADHFPTLKQLFLSNWGWGASVPGPYDGMSFYIGSLNIGVLIIGFAFILFRSTISSFAKKTLFWSILVTLVSIAFMNFRSSILWSNLPLIAYFQFPWRFLLLTTTATAAISAIVFSRTKSIIFFTIIISSLLLLEGWKFHPHDYLGRTDEYYLDRYIPVPYPSQTYTTLQEEYLRLPRTTSQKPQKLYPRFYPTSPTIGSMQIFNPLSASVETSSLQPFILNYNKYAFPGWKVYLDNQPHAYYPGSPYGQIQFEVPSGNHTIKVDYQETSTNLVLDIVSLIGLILAFILIVLPI